ncbi:vitamin K epoxide reductase family protein [Candidatus Woesearchaeota archaeon]|nr:vitamin K epoxide reductase family protein [Candidatus Woesearchaeota archaeon]
MKEKTRTNLYKWLIGLSLIGLIISIYLVFGHFADVTEGSICDISATISCSEVNTSQYSEMFNVPVAIFGVIWFIVLILMSWRALNKEGVLHIGILLWNIVGLGSVFYLIWAEFILGAICPFCTVVHIIIVTNLIISIILFKTGKKLSLDEFQKSAKSWIVLIIILNLIPLIYFNLPEKEQINYDNLTKCVTVNGVSMYSSFTCAVCKKQREYLGNSFQYINEIECHPRGENPQTALCLEKSITGTPTWILEKNNVETKRFVGFMTAKSLAEFAGCEYDG